ncbi:EAL domain-containing protein [Klebsiella pneumoniae]|uniref:EAL domain-containing protein n=1 Tax=Klebsiella pneumoniae TaxID=573 RepID=A0A927HVS4_KLEPN|nr:EAL domain-containing protein [Klebsiella pneumoniae]MBO1997869.1 EAL domain-containing protein [Klebsiella pneumoniae]
MLCHGTVCVVGKIRDLILQLSKSSIYSTKPFWDWIFSLNYLREFPFDAIKLDRTFISGIAHVARDLSIVRSIVSLGKAFSLGIVAEGVENNEQFELLKI